MQRSIRYFEDPSKTTMLPSSRHVVNSHGTIEAPGKGLTKRERAKIKRKNKNKRDFVHAAPIAKRVGAFFA